MKLTNSQIQAIELIKSGRNVFLKGVAGTGKTFLLNALPKLFPDKNVYLTASSGAAALNLEDGRTISSFLGLGKYDESTYTGYCRYYLNNSILVIDEIGLIGETQWNFIIKSIKDNSKRGKRPQIIIAGDPAQMPPIYWDKPMSKKQLRGFRKYELKDIVRQKDADFIKELMKLRKKPLTKKDLDFFLKNSGNKTKKGVRLVINRTIMDKVNQMYIEKNKRRKIYKIDLTDVKDPDRPYDVLSFFKGLKVLITRNKYSYGSPVYVNGDTGTIAQISDDLISVILDRNKEEVWIPIENKAYEYITEKNENGIKKVVERYKYFPILPCYALSIRRAQGMTITKGVVDESVIKSNDRAAQYTAFSRFKKLSGIFIDL